MMISDEIDERLQLLEEKFLDQKETIEVNSEDCSLHGSIIFIDAKLSYSGQSFTELEHNFRRAVEAHLQACRERGEEPPFTG